MGQRLARASIPSYVFTPSQGAVTLPHPLYGHPMAPEALAQALFAQQQEGDVEVSVRSSGGERSGRQFVVLVFWFKNVNPTSVVSIRPQVDVMDGTGRVMQVHDIGKLVAAARAGKLNSASSSSFFYARGSRQFVDSAMTGYAIGSVLSQAVANSQNQKARQALEFFETHWLKDEYRLPPGAKTGAVVRLNGLPELPLTVRVTIADRVYSFKTVNSYKEGEAEILVQNPAVVRRGSGNCLPRQDGSGLCQ